MTRVSAFCRLTASILFVFLSGQRVHAFVEASGGTVTTNGSYRFHTFTTNNTALNDTNFVVTAGGEIAVVIVAGGGGGGGGAGGGGGGGGGVIVLSAFTVAPGNYLVRAGRGGAGSAGADGARGSNSVFHTFTACGGGGGGRYNGAGLSGGSGGGAGRDGGAGVLGGNGTNTQGYAGGNSCTWGAAYGGGGGGASAPGGNGSGTPQNATPAGYGGAGRTNNITGSDVVYGGGGGGGAYNSAVTPGGTGGGGNGGNDPTSRTAGVDGRGGGGGGLRAGSPARGGSGTVIIRYPVSSKPGVDNFPGATNITSVSATLRGTLLSTGASPAQVWVCWGPTDCGTNGGPTYWPHTNAFGTNTAPTPCHLSTNIAGLVRGTDYFYRFRAKGTAGESWAASTATFRTPDISNDGGATNVGFVSAVLRGTVSDMDPAPGVYVCYDTSDRGVGSTTNWSKVASVGTVTGNSFQTYVCKLAPEVLYYYRCYATNAEEGLWSETPSSFTTRPRPEQNQVIATGGTTSLVNMLNLRYMVHTFRSNGNFVVRRTGWVDVLAVGGGGGGGGGDGGGGGGAGGVLHVTNLPVVVSNYAVTVGQGGAGSVGGNGATGDNSVFAELTVYGGGGGGFYKNAGLVGGSGGGAGRDNGAAIRGGAGTLNQGCEGGNSCLYAQAFGGGGGGAGAPGGNGGGTPQNETSAGFGGRGVTNNITGTNTVYGGGGGAGAYSGALIASGGSGGGGNGANNITPATAGVNGLGGGGDGRRTGSGGNGGSGIVMVRYRLFPPWGTMMVIK